MADNVVFRVGDIVFLKSGGLAMTVEAVAGETGQDGFTINKGSVGVVWFNEMGNVRRGEFALAVLRHREGCGEAFCVHCFPEKNCERDNCPHCGDEEDGTDPEDN